MQKLYIVGKDRKVHNDFKKAIEDARKRHIENLEVITMCGTRIISQIVRPVEA